MSKLSEIAEFWEFLRTCKKWWLAPIIVFLVLVSSMIFLSEGSAIAPFIYAMF